MGIKSAVFAVAAISLSLSLPSQAESLTEVTSSNYDLTALADYLKDPDAPATDEAVIKTGSLTIIDTRKPETDVRFDTALIHVAPEIQGLSLSQIIGQSPSYPPVEGLPDIAWKDQECANCHQWERVSLCEQGTFYTRTSGADALSKQHPFGGSFKQSLRQWAQGGCE